jgi:subtilisin family serine protease
LLALALTACRAPVSTPLPVAAVLRFEPTLAPAAREALAARYAPTAVVPLFDDVERWRLADAAQLSALAAEPGVRYALPDGRHQLAGVTVPADPRVDEQWDMRAAGFWEARALADGTGVTVAVLDSGVDLDHPDLRANLLPGFDEVADLADPELPADPERVRDFHGHGTHVAGTVAAVADNHEGIAGGAPGAKLLPVKIANANGDASDASIAKGVADAVAAGARVINLSVGGERAAEPVLVDAVDLALAHGASVVVATGNEGAASINGVARRGTIAVGGLLANGAVAGYSNTGAGITLLAPGGGNGGEGPGVFSTVPTYPCTLTRAYGLPTGYAPLAGTSMAAPHVSAAVALLLQREPGLTPAQVLTRVAASARQKGLLAYDELGGFGALDVARLLGSGSHDGATI